ncbi:DUF2771 family protein [Williamsia maris]|uniref:DUF2771 domain-containing protein n=1 Tax=Williamsia maris TaxID=72806 RepID=A0ABT1HB33_9NOCA|nr:DUF2771 family protein [Williamsia maris]MCP2174888.1 Protein of unknown function (DUF2771) [Williamsia maris]
MFTLKAGEKKFLAIATIVALVFVAVVGSAVALLVINNDHDEVPYLQATTGTTLVHVEPTILCEIDLSNCKKGAEDTFAPRVPVPAGESIIVSLSSGIFDAPWALTLEFLTPKGFEQQPPEFFAPDEKYSFTVRSTKERLLTNIEVRLPSGRTDTAGAPITRGFWSINTLPEGTQVPAQS